MDDELDEFSTSLAAISLSGANRVGKTATALQRTRTVLELEEDRDVRHLRWLDERIGEDLLDAVVVTAGRHAYRRRDGIVVVTAAMLGP